MHFSSDSLKLLAGVKYDLKMEGFLCSLLIKDGVNVWVCKHTSFDKNEHTKKEKQMVLVPDNIAGIVY